MGGKGEIQRERETSRKVRSRRERNSETAEERKTRDKGVGQQ